MFGKLFGSKHPDKKEPQLTTRYKTGFLRFSWLYTAIFIGGSLIGVLIAYTTPYGDRSGIGCAFYDSLIYGIDCHGFPGAPAIEIVVGLPLFITQISLFFLPPSLFNVFILVILWSPIIATLYSFIRYLILRCRTSEKR